LLDGVVNVNQNSLCLWCCPVRSDKQPSDHFARDLGFLRFLGFLGFLVVADEWIGLRFEILGFSIGYGRVCCCRFVLCYCSDFAAAHCQACVVFLAFFLSNTTKIWNQRKSPEKI